MPFSTLNMKKSPSFETIGGAFKSMISATVVLTLIYLDLIICIGLVGCSLYDNANPSLSHPYLNIFQLLSTDIAAATIWRNVFFWTHAIIRTVFVVELIVKFYKCGLKALLKPLPIIDNIAIVVGFVTRFTLSGREALLLNFIIILRFVKHWMLLDNVVYTLEHESDERKVLLERHYEAMLRNADNQTQATVAKLRAAEDKLKVMLGDISAADLIH